MSQKLSTQAAPSLQGQAQSSPVALEIEEAASRLLSSRCPPPRASEKGVRPACRVGGEGLGLQGNRSWGRFTFHNKDRLRTTLFGPRGGGGGEGGVRKSHCPGRAWLRWGQKEALTPGRVDKGPSPFPRSPFFSLPPYCSLATHTDGIWDRAPEKQRKEISQPP